MTLDSWALDCSFLTSNPLETLSILALNHSSLSSLSKPLSSLASTNKIASDRSTSFHSCCLEWFFQNICYGHKAFFFRTQVQSPEPAQKTLLTSSLLPSCLSGLSSVISCAYPLPPPVSSATLKHSPWGSHLSPDTLQRAMWLPPSLP